MAFVKAAIDKFPVKLAEITALEAGVRKNENGVPFRDPQLLFDDITDPAETMGENENHLLLSAVPLVKDSLNYFQSLRSDYNTRLACENDMARLMRVRIYPTQHMSNSQQLDTEGHLRESLNALETHHSGPGNDQNMRRHTVGLANLIKTNTRISEGVALEARRATPAPLERERYIMATNKWRTTSDSVLE